MILKTSDGKGNWTWTQNVEHIENMGLLQEALNEIEEEWVEYIGAERENTSPHILKVVINGTEKYLGTYGDRAFLCADNTGKTIDIIFS